MILYDHPASANCMKARILLRQLEIPFERVTVDLFTGETRTPEHFGRNADGRIPVLELDSGETIPESGAILAHLAEGTPYLPSDRLARTRVLQWMLFEQNRIEAELSYARFLKLSGRADQLPEVHANRLQRGEDALEPSSAGSRTDATSSPATTRSPTSRCTPTCTARTTPAPSSASTSGSAPGSRASRPRQASRTTSSRCRLTPSSGRSER